MLLYGPGQSVKGQPKGGNRLCLVAVSVKRVSNSGKERVKLRGCRLVFQQVDRPHFLTNRAVLTAVRWAVLPLHCCAHGTLHRRPQQLKRGCRKIKKTGMLENPKYYPQLPPLAALQHWGSTVCYLAKHMPLLMVRRSAVSLERRKVGLRNSIDLLMWHLQFLDIEGYLFPWSLICLSLICITQRPKQINHLFMIDNDILHHVFTVNYEVS